MSTSANDPNSPSLLVHPLRRKIYSIIAENPGTYFFNLAKFLELPQGTLNWHLKRLESVNLIKSIKFAGKRVYYPSGLRSAEAAKIFTALLPDTAKKIFVFGQDVVISTLHDFDLMVHTQQPYHDRSIAVAVSQIFKFFMATRDSLQHSAPA